MKIDIQLDMTPQEFRELMGWPDVRSFQGELFDQVRRKMEAGVEGYDPQSLLQPFLAQSFSAMENFQKIMGAMMKDHGGAGRKEE